MSFNLIPQEPITFQFNDFKNKIGIQILFGTLVPTTNNIIYVSIILFI